MNLKNKIDNKIKKKELNKKIEIVGKKRLAALHLIQNSL